MSLKQVGSPTKAIAGFIKNGLPLRWEAAVGSFNWGNLQDLVGKTRLARSEWQGRVGKSG